MGIKAFSKKGKCKALRSFDAFALGHYACLGYACLGSACLGSACLGYACLGYAGFSWSCRNDLRYMY